MPERHHPRILLLGVLVAIVHDELYRKRFLPTVTDADLDRLARKALHEKTADNT